MKKKTKIIIGIIVAVLVVAGVLAVVLWPRTDYKILVNKEHLVPEDYIKTVKLVEVENYEGRICLVEEKTYQAFEDLCDELLTYGIVIDLDDGYRSLEYQQQTMDKFIELYGEEYAKKTVAIPGTSEHHTGLAIDVLPQVNGQWIEENEDMMKEVELFATVHSHLAKHGFILRYPKGKESITGYDYEPWHFRYVGEEIAQEIMEKGITFEEYLGE